MDLRHKENFTVSTLFLVIFSLCFPGSFDLILAQRVPIKFEVDYASFKGDEGEVTLEVYLSLARNQLRVVETDSSHYIAFEVEVLFFNADSLTLRYSWRNTTEITEQAGLGKNQRLLTQSKFVVLPMQYRMVVVVRDLNSDARGQKGLELNLTSFSDTAVSISDIELANLVAKDSTSSIFTKSGLRVIPNPSLLYRTTSPMLYFYAEIYNLHQMPDSTYTVEYKILHSDDSEYRSYPPKTRHKPGALAVESGGVNVVTFPTNSYMLQLNVLDSAGKLAATRSKRFFMFRTRKTEQDSIATNAIDLYKTYLATEYEQKSQSNIDDEFQSANSMASKEEKKIFKSLDLTGKQRFMAEFWARRPGLREVHLKRLQYANDKFSGIKKGWQTDRGRVFVTYGQPDKVEKNFSLTSRHAYEIWRYHEQQGGLIFVFVDKGGFDDLELVHSNAPTEISDPGWKRWTNTTRF